MLNIMLSPHCLHFKDKVDDLDFNYFLTLIQNIYEFRIDQDLTGYLPEVSNYCSPLTSFSGIGNWP